MAAGTGRYARKKHVRKKPILDPAHPPFGKIMQDLLPMVAMMRNMGLEGGATARSPKLVLTGSGLELCFSDADSPSTQPAQSPDRLAEIERSLKLLSARVGAMEERQSYHASTIDALAAAVKLNEEMLEALVDSLTATDDFSFGQSELALRPKNLAS